MKTLSAALKDLNSASLILYRGMAVGSSEGLVALARCSWQQTHGLKAETFSKSAEHLGPVELCSLHLRESMIYRDNPQTFQAGLRIDNISKPMPSTAFIWNRCQAYEIPLRVADTTARFISSQPSSSHLQRRHCKQSADHRHKPGRQRRQGFKGRRGFRQTMTDSV